MLVSLLLTYFPSPQLFYLLALKEKKKKRLFERGCKSVPAYGGEGAGLEGERVSSQLHAECATRCWA